MRSRADRRRLQSAARTSAAALAVAALLPATAPAEAQPRTVTKVKYYTVDGKTASDLDRQMTSRGPWHGGGRAYANIVAKPDYSGELVQGSSCRLENFTVSAEFTMTLPKLASTSGMPGDLLGRWKSFQDFVQRHEDGHREIWIDSMGKAERRITALRAPTCRQLQAKVDEVFAAEWSRAERRQDAYDRAEQGKLMRHPLIVAATRVPRGKANAIARSQPTQSRAVSHVPRTRVLDSR